MFTSTYCVEDIYLDMMKKNIGSGRLYSLNALRGFDRLMISGGGLFIFRMHGKTGMGWIDRAIMPGQLANFNGVYDELVISTHLPAFILTILGVWIGDILQYNKTNSLYRIKTLIIIGASLLGLGLVWGLHLPIARKLWTGSFIMVASGASTIAMVLFYWLIDVKKYTKWAFFFKVVGLNSLFILQINLLILKKLLTIYFQVYIVLLMRNGISYLKHSEP